MQFLNSMQQGWNITLFHYRNHGSDSGRVLVGMQVPANQDNALQQFIAKLGFPCVEETSNPAYQLFLGD